MRQACKKSLNRLLILALLLAGCGKIYSSRFYAPDELRKDVKKVAVLPFNDLTGGEGVSLAVTKLFAEEMARAWGVKVIEGEDLNRQLSLKRIRLDDTVSRLSAARIAQALEADAVIFGSVLEYRYRNWVTRQGKVTGDPVVCIGARLVNGETGTVVWAATDVKTEYNIFSARGDVLSGMAQRVVKDLVKTVRLNKK